MSKKLLKAKEKLEYISSYVNQLIASEADLSDETIKEFTGGLCVVFDNFEKKVVNDLEKDYDKCLSSLPS